MCCILCCCCNWCNPYSSKCVEISILILSITSFLASMIGLFFVNKKHISTEAYACLLIVILFSVLLIISIILILIWRLKSQINNKRNFAGAAFSKIGLISTIFCLLFTAIWESLSISNFYDLNNPCQSVERTDIKIDNNTNLLNLLIRRNRRVLLTYEENKEEFCLENPKYKINVVSTSEYIYLWVSASALELILLVLLYFWYNDFRRIKYLVDGQLVDSNTKETKIKYDSKKSNFNNKFNLMLYGRDYVAHYDIFGRPIFNMQKRKSKPEIINNSRNNLDNKLNYPRIKDRGMIMGKYNLGKSIARTESKLSRDELYLNEVKTESVIKNTLKELDDISVSLQKINIILNRSVKIGAVKGSKANSFKAWARKSKEQANNAVKLKEKVSTKYNKDVKDYPIKLLDDRIAELEKKIAAMGN